MAFEETRGYNDDRKFFFVGKRWSKKKIISTVSTYLQNNYRWITWKRRKLLTARVWLLFFALKLSSLPCQFVHFISLPSIKFMKLNSRCLFQITWQIILTMLKIGPLFFHKSKTRNLFIPKANQSISLKIVTNSVLAGVHWKEICI